MLLSLAAPTQTGLDLSLFIPPDPVKTALLAGVVPGVIAALALLFIWWRKPKAENPTLTNDRRRWLMPMTIAGLAVFAEITIRGWPNGFLPAQVGNRFVLLGLLLGIAGIAQAVTRPTRIGWLLGVMLAFGAVVWLLVGPALSPDHRKFAMGLAHGGVFIFAISLLAACLDWAHTRAPGWRVPLAAMPAFALAGPALVLANTAPAAQLSAILPAVVGAAVLIALFRPRLSLSRGPWTVLIAWHVALVLYNTFWGYRGLSAPAAVMLALAPIGGIVPALPKLRSNKPIVGVLIGAAVSGGLALGTLVLAYQAAANQPVDAYY